MKQVQVYISLHSSMQIFNAIQTVTLISGYASESRYYTSRFLFLIVHAFSFNYYAYLKIMEATMFPHSIAGISDYFCCRYKFSVRQLHQRRKARCLNVKLRCNFQLYSLTFTFFILQFGEKNPPNFLVTFPISHDKCAKQYLHNDCQDFFIRNYIELITS